MENIMAKITKVELTEEQVLQNRIESFLKDYKCKIKPTRVFNVGDEVVIGYIQNPVIVDYIMDETGTIRIGYVISHDSIPTEHQQKFAPSYGIKAVWAWYDIFAPNEEKSAYNDNIMRLQYFNTSLMELIREVLNDDIDMEPDYQRDYVWEPKDKEDLITSIFEGNEIGRFVVKQNGFRKDKKYLEIVDGKQRLNAIVEYITGQWKWKGKYFNELLNTDRMRFEHTGILICTIRENVSKEDVIKMFIKINTVGKVMDKEHIENIKNKYVQSN